MFIHYEGMRHAPENELGVVFLFSKMARRLRFIEIDRIQPGFPDCRAWRRTANGVREVWIEFEFRSSSFRLHVGALRDLRPRRGVVVCWEHNWPDCERYAEVIELRTELGVGRQVWIQNTKPEYQAQIDDAPRRRLKEWTWTVPGGARPGDLLLMYRAGSRPAARRHEVDPELLQSIANVFVMRSFPKAERRWKWEAEVSQVALLSHPLRLEHMRKDRILRSAPFVRRSMIGRSNATSYWYRVYDLIVRLNRDRETIRLLAPYRPEVF